MSSALEAATGTMAESRAFTHNLLERMRTDRACVESAKRFAVQWFKAATAHKKAFPGLVYNVKDDEVRLGLIDILNEEYGFGELDMVHARVLYRFLQALGISVEEAEASETADGVDYFSRHVDAAWLKSDPDFAYGVHYALEFLAANMHQAFYVNVAKLGLPEDSIAYFKIHSTAEIEHAEKARQGLKVLARDSESEARLVAGMEHGTELVERLLDGLEVAYTGKLH